MEKEQCFYMVYLDGKDTPAFKHTNLDSAEKEAKRLAELHDTKAYVLCTIKSIEVNKFNIRDCRPEDDVLPF